MKNRKLNLTPVVFNIRILDPDKNKYVALVFHQDGGPMLPFFTQASLAEEVIKGIDVKLEKYEITPYTWEHFLEVIYKCRDFPVRQINIDGFPFNLPDELCLYFYLQDNEALYGCQEKNPRTFKKHKHRVLAYSDAPLLCVELQHAGIEFDLDKIAAIAFDDLSSTWFLRDRILYINRGPFGGQCYVLNTNDLPERFNKILLKIPADMKKKLEET